MLIKYYMNIKVKRLIYYFSGCDYKFNYYMHFYFNEVFKYRQYNIKFWIIILFLDNIIILGDYGIVG